MMTIQRLHARRRRLLFRIAGASVLATIGVPVAGLAQASYPVVQSTASGAAGSRQLNFALSRLANNPRDLSALLDAGNAALILGDTDAALGFLSRADQISPNNPRVKAALAGALVRSENPYDALAYFDQAERAGASVGALAGDRGLAYDLVGDNTSAQRYYQQAITMLRSDEVVRRYALSLAISGDRKGADAALAPLLQRQDPAAWRTRAFILAISGEAVEAEKVAAATMPPHLAAAIRPYLHYMPRLTPAQQAAAANFGQFPRAAQIGKDDPRAARYAVTSTPMGAGSRLKPAGEPLGRRRTKAKAKATPRDRAKTPGKVAAAPPKALAAAPVTGARTPIPGPAPAPVVQQPAPVQVAVVQPTVPARPPATAPRPVYGPLTSSAGVASGAVTTVPPRPVVPPVPAARAAPAVAPPPVRAIELPAIRPATATTSPTATPPATVAPTSAAAPAVATPPPVRPIELPAIGLATASASPSVAPSAAVAPVPAAVTAVSPPQPALADLFSDYRPPAEEQRAPVIAVDLSTIKPRREVPAIIEKPDVPIVVGRSETRVAATTTKVAAKTAAKPATPANPSRIWVQLGVGGDKSALAFDWKRLNKANAALFKGRSPSTTPLRATNRLLTGPFSTEAEARAFLEKLRKAEIDALLWTSPAGQAVDALKL